MYAFNNGKFKEAHVWWDTEPDFSADVDVFYFINDLKPRAEYSFKYVTSEIDLNLSEDEIFSKFKSRLRNQLRSEENRELSINFIQSPSTNNIEWFVTNFNSFAEWKGIGKTSVEYLTKLASENKLIISNISYNGEVIYSHTHYVSGSRARLLHSFSPINEAPNEIISHANKYLTFKEIFYFKNIGIQIYDFGGLFHEGQDTTKVEGIIKFKRSFGGNDVEMWKGVTPNGERGIPVMEKYFGIKAR